MQELEGKVAVITGAGSGMGKDQDAVQRAIFSMLEGVLHSDSTAFLVKSRQWSGLSEIQNKKAANNPVHPQEHS